MKEINGDKQGIRGFHLTETEFLAGFGPTFLVQA